MRLEALIASVPVTLIAGAVLMRRSEPLPITPPDVDISTIALELDRQIFPDLDVKAYHQKLDYLADLIRQVTEDEQDPLKRIGYMNAVLYKSQHFSYDMEGFQSGEPETSSLAYTLAKKKGNCMGLALLYLSVAQRLGYPIYAVRTPRHVFLRYIGPDMQTYNIEPTDEGGIATDTDYILTSDIHPRMIVSGAYMHTLTHKQFAADIYYSMARRTPSPGAKLYFAERALVFNPENIYALMLVAKCYEGMEKYSDVDTPTIWATRRNRIMSLLSTLVDPLTMEAFEKEPPL